ncbi:hypothetical protein K443DRAFT_135000 [Laccaria amethystina LaAM-08-1]|uniref:BTB domain-containing protein n=1 Tax=Laccaria amethystina LaAM-08-1 TaxID=1095629 RepID=A0A0C9WIV2_9AGAR|nr:hypothetical protein K443DRAFT_135000 [Laccaria amethystina LaAM-08-1]
MVRLDRERSPEVIRSRRLNLVYSDFWFLDGNIVLVAESAAFKVHRGQLERHSEVFSDLFSIPQPQEQELIDGCNWVELHDRASDLFYFLSAIYDGLYFKNPCPEDFPVVAAVLRLSTKYLAEHLRLHCLARLDLDWPTTLGGWDMRELEATDSHGRYFPRETYPHPILVIELALEMSIPSILPSAFYDLSRYCPSKIFAGATYLPCAFDVIVSKNSSIPPLLQSVTLPHDMIIRIFRGRDTAQRYLADFVSRELDCREPCAQCTNRGDKDYPSRVCHESFHFIMLNVFRSVSGIATGRDADPLFSLVQAMEMLTRTDFSDGQRQCGLNICYPCKLDVAACVSKARKEVWDLLPFWFGLLDDAKTENAINLD